MDQNFNQNFNQFLPNISTINASHKSLTYSYEIPKSLLKDCEAVVILKKNKPDTVLIAPDTATKLFKAYDIVNSIGGLKNRINHKYFCEKCNKIAEYTIKNTFETEYKGLELNVLEETAVCKTCNNEIFVPDIENANLIRLYAKYDEETSKETNKS